MTEPVVGEIDRSRLKLTPSTIVSCMAFNDMPIERIQRHAAFCALRFPVVIVLGHAVQTLHADQDAHTAGLLTIVEIKNVYRLET